MIYNYFDGPKLFSDLHLALLDISVKSFFSCSKSPKLILRSLSIRPRHMVFVLELNLISERIHSRLIVFIYSVSLYICKRCFFVKVIVLNGETGTGKTFNAWKALEFLTKNAYPEVLETRDVVCGIVRKISVACRLISAFTTAPTEINKVSSRHVQLVWLEYKMGSICGATISSYLLERDRVTKGCCNFQIFSQVKETSASCAHF